MANGNVVSSTLPSRDYHCKICDLYLDTVDSLEVHLQYHKENLYVKWGTQNIQNDAENNNSTKIKSEPTVSAAADSSDSMITKPSPEFQQRATPETSAQFPHPATPQSYHSAPSPYQNPDQTNFSPGNQYGNSQYTHSNFNQNQHSEQINWESQYNQDFHKPARFHPYNVQDRVSQVSSSSPLYGQPLNQPTPSPSPNQCDKCGFVCDSAVQLNEHCNSAHTGPGSATNAATSSPFQQFPQKQYTSGFQNDNTKVKEEHEESSDILDLDSQKVVYPGNENEQQGPPFEQNQGQGRDANTRTVPMIPWEAQKLYGNPQLNGDSSLFKEQKIFSEQKSYPTESKIFHPDQKFAYTQDKFLPVHHDQKAFMHSDKTMYPGVQMPPLSEYGLVGSTNPDMKPPYRPYDSPTAPQISSTQPANTSSTALPSIGGKGANWKSNEARRPKTYNCTACNKWFTSSGHLKRHYNTTLHKNAVRSSGQPDPATMPISSHHHPSRESLQNRGATSAGDANTQSPVSADDGRGGADDAIHSPYSAQGYERSHRGTAAMQSKSPYSHLQGNIDNNFMSNNPLANHPLPHQVGTHPLNIGSQPPGIGNIESGHQGTKGAAMSTSGNPPNGEAGPSATQNHHLRGLLSVSTSNITTPVLTQSTPQLTPHTLPPFSHLAVNPYSPRSTDPLAPSVPDPTHTPLYLGQNFQQTIAPNYPNGMAPHVMDMAINNLHIASPATFGESIPEEAEVVDNETPNGIVKIRLPSFSQFQPQRYGVFVPNYVTSPNVGGQVTSDEPTVSYIVVDAVNGQIPYNNVDLSEQRLFNYDYKFASQPMKTAQGMEANQVKMSPYGYAISVKSVNKNEEPPRTDSTEIQILKIEDIMDYANKENYVSQMKSPGSPESAKAEYESSSSPAVTSTVPGTPLVESNQVVRSAGAGASGGASAGATGEHRCFECDKFFNKACYLTQHNKSFHSGDKPFKCERCGKRFSDDTSYEEHFMKHAPNKPFKCQQCPKSFNHKTDLRRHMCLHSGTKPFACHHCGKGFIRKDHMLKHCETHRKKNPPPRLAP